ncbi:MAG: glycosyltransferase, partial [Gemmatimonadaceae bacterium]
PASCFRPLTPDVDRGSLRTRLTGTDEPYFLFAGKLSGRRNLPLLIEAFAEFRRRFNHPHRLVMVGPDAAMQKVRDMADSMKISSHVVTRTFVPDAELNELYNCAEAFVMPSAYETVSFPIMEAQATATPVICIDTPGAREMTGAEALLIPRLNVDEVASAMARLASDPELRARLAERGRENSRRFSWEKCASETLAICREAADSARPTS